ncbi:hypothetical protein BAUCODRAFT_121537 [Baudoinia panamericana UAMH 10762]|uniref:Alcohol dehydrogenase-like C-terminal domain-containing protein n=1 Tax=Baudoinia panamericana (strain UAMH 10762) TaxID=717646 RepID=M2MZI6_BAUPA|nr:uncharacterized protein BAUCODRAFT_121537 [Baudoinia panamericana UAMH 10762]EMC97013.1 hypothetical protein BAUCODRAFT_121537 [Baudoinia panamericana UAMH 10762]
MIPKPLLEGVQVLNSKDLSEEALVDRLKQLTPNGLGMDFALDCVGNEDVVHAAYLSLDKLGMLLTVGGSNTAKPSFAIERNLVNGLTIRGTHQGDSESRVMIPKLIQMWKDGQFAFDLMQAEYRFEDLAKAIEDMHAGKVIKPLLVT